MSYTNGLDKPDDYFNTVLYTGDGTSDRTITNTFATDFLWLKERNGTDWHHLWDKVRGDGKRIHTNNTNAESDLGTYIALVSTGFKVDGGTYNNSGSQYAAWQWKANGSGSSNTDGSITSTVSANTTSGFSIVSYTSNCSASQTVGHGLGVAPNVIISKNRTDGGATYGNWVVYHSSLATANDTKILLNSTAASSTTNEWGDTDPTSTVYSVHTSGDGATNHSSDNIIAYCFAEKKGFSKFGKYTGNGNADGTFVYTGFSPSFVMHKRTDTTNNWIMQDNKRVGYNADNRILKANLSDAEQGVHEMDFVSNGFKIRTTGLGSNASGGSYIYMAFAENPFVTSTGIPTTGR